LDNYEAGRHDRRPVDDFEIPEEKRVDLLLQMGYSIQDLLEADIKKTRDQLLRQRTMGKLKDNHVEELFEGIRLKYVTRMRNLEQSQQR